MSSNIKLGDIVLDSAQTTRKAWCDDKDGHRVVPVNVDYNKVDYTYKANGQICTVEYSYDNNAESTKTTFVADSCCSLNGKSFTLSAACNVRMYNILYSVCCGTTIPEPTCEVKYILVNIQTNDPAEVVTLATSQALSLNCCFSADMCVLTFSDYIKTTNTVSGIADDATDKGTGFTFCILTQGSICSIEKLTYLYDDCCVLTQVKTQSGTNVLNINEPVDRDVTLSSKGNQVDVTSNNELRVEFAPIQEEIFDKILTELRIMNTHLTILTGNEIKKSDLDTKDDL
jgi:hypothetical protein